MREPKFNVLLSELSEIKELLRALAQFANPAFRSCMNYKIETLEFRKPYRSRILCSLEDNNITKLSHLLSETESDLKRYPNMGAKCLQEIKRVLQELGLELSK